jgi:amino acid adenylation domain-containing protein
VDAPVTRPLTGNERLIYAGQRLNPDLPLYNMALAVHVEDRLDEVRLGRALREVVQDADALRTVVREEGGTPEVTILSEAVVELDVVEVLDDHWSDGTLQSLLEERARRPMPMDRPMLDVALFRSSERSVLFLGQHHLITDAESVAILYRRLSEAYETALPGVEEPPLGSGGNGALAAVDREPSPQFIAYVHHLDEVAGSPAFERAVEQWRATAVPEAGPLRFYGAESTGRGRTRRVRVELDDERSRVLEELLSRPEFRALSLEHSRMLLVATVLSAWLSRVTDREQVALGMPIRHRTSAAFRETQGLFVELCPIGVEVGPGTSFRDLASRVREATWATMRAAVPGAATVPEARTFGVVLNVITARLGCFAGHGAQADWIHSGFGDPAHPVRVQVHDFNARGRPIVEFDLDESVFGPRERQWAVDHFLGLFDALARDLDARVEEEALVSWEDEASFAPRGARVPVASGVLAAFGRRVEEGPEDPAVIEGDEITTFSSLARRARGIADRLAATATRGGTVGVVMDRSADMVATLLGALRAGMAYVPLDPTHPDELLRLQLHDAGADLVLTQEHRIQLVRSWGVEAEAVEAIPLAEGVGRWDDPASEELAYVLFTSGSTGRPKGVEVTHGALNDYVAWAARTYDRGEGLSWAWFTSPAYDLTVTSIFVPLVAGGICLVYPEAQDGLRIPVLDVFSDGRAEVVKLTPSHLALLGSLDLSRCRTRRLILGGENLPTSLARAARAALGPHLQIYNEYGPTESTVACMIHRYDPDTDDGDSIPIGVPADNVGIHVLSPGGAPTLRGESGEICISGDRLARGYRGLPEITERAFVPHPGAPGKRLYRTGDLGRWRADGVLEFLGRTDDQVKVGGVRVELEEVEAALSRHPGVRAVAARVATQRLNSHERCSICGIEASHPEARIGDDGVCQLCVQYEGEREAVSRYFGQPDDLQRLLDEARERSTGPHDVIMLYSGGKDSTYALWQVVEMGARPLVFMLDNGFISDQAKENARRVVELLGLELVIGTTPEMPEVFAESLQRFSNVCQGCFKVIYNLALSVAVKRGISAIVTGLSRGQIFESRLADLYRRRVEDPEEVDRTIDEARRAYHRMDDAARPTLDAGDLTVDEILDRVTFIDFYRYCDVELDELLDFIGTRTPWIRPSDTGRSTNCLINEAGIYVHKAERGFHNYSLPYSWDVRLGHKERDAAVAELDDELDPGNVRQMLDIVGYQERPAPPPESRLIAYYVAEEEIPVSELRETVGRSLPRAVVPSAFIRLDALPLAPSGKVDRESLPLPGLERPAVGTPYVPARTPQEELLVEIWREVLSLDRIGIHDDFFELGGESMRCIQIAATARDRGLAFTPRDLFQEPTIARLAKVAEAVASTPDLVTADVNEDELDRLRQEFGE